MVRGSFGSIVTAPIEYDAWSSKIGVQVVPALTVFQTPPEATPTYQVLLSVGWMAMSLMRPEVIAGPIPRKRSPPSVAEVRPPLAVVSAAGRWAASGAASRS